MKRRGLGGEKLMGEGASLINLGELSKPATVLIEKISDAVGGIYKPHQIRRIAQAEADAALTHAKASLKVTDLQRRAMHRFVKEETKKQENIESITAKALPHVDAEAAPENVEDDWIANFFDKCRIVSDQEMQQLWAKVLAGEANTPGTYSKRTVNFIASLDREDAILFSKLCGFCCLFDELIPLVFNFQDPVYQREGITFDVLSHLEAIGLIKFEGVGEFQRNGLVKREATYYGGSFLVLEFGGETHNILGLGTVILTKTGKQLAPLCGFKPVEGFLEYVVRRWTGMGIIVSSPYPQVRPGEEKTEGEAE